MAAQNPKKRLVTLLTTQTIRPEYWDGKGIARGADLGVGGAAGIDQAVFFKQNPVCVERNPASACGVEIIAMQLDNRARLQIDGLP